MKVTFVTPPVLSYKGDYFASGIPYMPVDAPYAAALLRQQGHEVEIIDAFGIKPQQMEVYKQKYIIRGLETRQILELVKPADAYVLSANNGVVANTSVPSEITLKLVKMIKAKYPSTPIVMIGNFVSIEFKRFLEAGATYAILGEFEVTVSDIMEVLQGKKLKESLDGVVWLEAGKLRVRPKGKYLDNPDILPFPAYDLLPVENYWALDYAHGPTDHRRYLPILTSRGCPLNCQYCFVPGVWNNKWKPRSPKNVVDEMEYFYKKWNVSDFHFEDFNPTVDTKRIRDMCMEIVNRKLPVTWKLAAGSKVECNDVDTIHWMKKAGCRYVSISPESGSPEVLKLMQKPFNHEYALKMVSEMSKVGIPTQACFVLGFPGETDKDLELTRQYLKKLTFAGIDEVSLFIMTPVPGAPQWKNEWGKEFKDVEELNFSPEWRKDFKRLQRARLKLYFYYAFWRTLRYPHRVVKSLFNIFSKRFSTKMEMTVYRIIDTYAHLSTKEYA